MSSIAPSTGLQQHAPNELHAATFFVARTGSADYDLEPEGKESAVSTTGGLDSSFATSSDDSWHKARWGRVLHCRPKEARSGRALDQAVRDEI
jgi:hypothetical protein